MKMFAKLQAHQGLKQPNEWKSASGGVTISMPIKLLTQKIVGKR